MTDKQQLLSSAEEALQSLYTARNKLADARSLGVWDMFVGGFISSMLKHDRIKEVDDCLADAQDKLQGLLDKLELWPEKIYLHGSISKDQQFLDIAFDNIFSDMAVQDKIITAQKQIDEIIFMVKELIATLK